ncbi:hypothetical protein N473_06310 [Pseudoalteromonas luteoviolacea CPMOR-1]|uniref:Uncharacterized protein n=1 Tax=Pseudoalteromonas luteoviolacea CPMOR-1 TaxID=1365248 RepID=A0A167H0C2_9GAMM|nr:hypothetical protein [Pseudoalteromonas luteoviolacea]KZN57494.1 hypothetical protein N473_06310 [Pseudoalteromonas luteoviolacea CPMOR-1]
MKKLTTAMLFLMSLGAHAVEPIYVGGEQHSYTKSDFTPVIEGGKVVSYSLEVPVLVDAYDDFIGGYPELIFDVSGEANGTTSGSPLLVGMSVECSGTDIGYDADVAFERRGMVIPARFSIYNRKVTHGTCKSLKINVSKTGHSAADSSAVIENLNANLIIYLNLGF